MSDLRILTPEDQVIVTLNGFLVFELGVDPSRIERLTDAYVAGIAPTGAVVHTLWALIQEVDPDPMPDICDYLSDESLHQLAAHLLMGAGA